ncbi:MAG: GTPase [Planctomycetota bacterium]
MTDRYGSWTPAGMGGIHALGLEGPALARLADRFRTDRPGCRAQLRGLYFGTLCDTEGRAIDQALLALEGERDRGMLTLHGGPAVVAEARRMLEALGFADGTPACFGGTRLERDLLDALRRTVAPEGVGLFLAGLDGSLAARVGAAAAAARGGDAARAVALIAGLERGWQVRHGFLVPVTVALIGPEHAGKSTLFNRLVGYDRVVVTGVPGTTVDYVDETMMVRGYPLRLVDTPGIGSWADLAAGRSVPLAHPPEWAVLIDVIARAAGGPTDPGEPYRDRAAAMVWNKDDAGAGLPACVPGLAVAALSGRGVDRLVDLLWDRLTDGGRALVSGFFLPAHAAVAGRARGMLAAGRTGAAADLLEQEFEL